MTLENKSCVPCRGGIEPLTPEEAKAMLAQTPGWALNAECTTVSRKFKFKNFAEALAFVNKVGALAEQEDHHPDISFGWGYVDVLLFTHKIKGLHENDFIIAAKIGKLAV